MPRKTLLLELFALGVTPATAREMAALAESLTEDELLVLFKQMIAVRRRPWDVQLTLVRGDKS